MSAKEQAKETQTPKKQIRAVVPKYGGGITASYVSNMRTGPKGVINPGICSKCSQPLIYEDKYDSWVFYCLVCKD